MELTGEQKQDFLFLKRSSSAILLDKFNVHITDEELMEGITDAAFLGISSDYGIDSMYFLDEDNKIVDVDVAEDNAVASVIVIQTKNESAGDFSLSIFNAAATNFAQGVNISYFDIMSNDEEDSTPASTDDENFARKRLMKLFSKSSFVNSETTVYLYYVKNNQNAKIDDNLKNGWKRSLNNASKAINRDLRMKFYVGSGEDHFLTSRELDEFEDVGLSNPVKIESKTLSITALELVPYTNNMVQAYSIFTFLPFLGDFLKGNNDLIAEGLFLDNVRADMSLNDTNKKIQSTLNGDSEFDGDFWWLSNGITIVADDITIVDPSTIELQNPQIVNGQQTSRMIFRNKESLVKQDWHVEIKLIIFRKGYNLDTRDSIIEGVNTQTKIKPEALKSLNKNVQFLKKWLRERKPKIYLETRANEYRNSNSIDKGNSIDLALIGQYIAAGMLGKVSVARNSKSKLFESDDFVETLFVTENEVEENEAWWDSFIRFSINFEKKWSTYSKTIDSKDRYTPYSKFIIFRFSVNYSIINGLSKPKLHNFSEINFKKGIEIFDDFREYVQTNYALEDELDIEDWAKFSKLSALDRIIGIYEETV